MLKLIKRCPEYVSGYKAYCQELYDNNVIYFRPTDPKLIDDDWFDRTKGFYDKKETGEIQPVSFHFWAVDGVSASDRISAESNDRHRQYRVCGARVRTRQGIRYGNIEAGTDYCQRVRHEKSSFHYQ